MAKKILKYMKKTYADVVKGFNEEPEIIEISDVSEEEGQPGESVIKSSWVGFSYSSMSPSSCSSSDERPKTPKRKRRPRRQTKRATGSQEVDLGAIIISSGTSDVESPVKKQKMFTRFSDNDSDSLPDLLQDKSCNGNVVERNDVIDTVSTVYEVESEFKGHYNENRKLPIYKFFKHRIKTKDAVRLLLRDFPKENICSDVPTYIDSNVSFIYSADRVGNWKNAMCDGMGKWTQTGTESHLVPLDDADDVRFVEQSQISDNTLKVLRRKYVNGSNCSLHRVIITIEKDEVMRDTFFVQYFFDGIPQPCEIKPHGNSKNDNIYTRTSETTKERIRKLCETNAKPKDIFHTILEEQGGIETVKSSASFPKCRNKVSYFKKSTKTQIDPLLECTHLAKEQESKTNKFIRDVRSAPAFTMLLATDSQLQNLRKFCTQNKKISVLGVDTTFNIGQYYITATSYRHLMLETSKGSEPVMFGPILLHQKKTFDSYFKLPSGLIQECPELKHVKVFGTDGDENLSSAFQVNFTDAKHLMCDIHMFDNIQRKLSSLAIEGHVASLYIKDIFGEVVERTKLPGLVDCLSAEEFDRKINDLKEPWIRRHRSGVIFYHYFIDYKSDIIKQCMSADLRSMCGLGFPPKPYTQNPNECLNSVMKKELIKQKGQKLDPYDFVHQIEKVIMRQENEIKLSLIGKGEYRVKSEYSHLCVNETSYWRKSSNQRQAVYKSFCSELLQPKISSDAHTQLLETSTLEDNHSDELDDVQNDDRELLDGESSQSFRLAISADQSGIITVPYRLLREILTSAEALLDDDSNIIPVPGCSDKRLYFVANSKRPENPYKLRYAFSSGNITCDKQCIRYASLKLCQHTLALAQKVNCLEQFINAFRRNSKGSNLTKASTGNLPNSRGKKATQATSRRKGKSNSTSFELLQYSGSLQSVTPPSPFAQTQPFHLTFMAGLIRKCYGCGQSFNQKHKSSPHDLLLRRYDHRIYTSPRSKETKITQNLQNTYFHLNANCARKLDPGFEMKNVIIHDEIREQLTLLHEEKLKNLKVLP